MQARLPWLRRLAFRLCQDWQRADDLVQAAIIDLYVQRDRAAAADHIDGYARTILVRKYLSERRSRWFRQVILPGGVPDGSGGEADHEMARDVRSAVAGLPAGQRAARVALLLDLSVEQTARELGCSEGRSRPSCQTRRVCITFPDQRVACARVAAVDHVVNRPIDEQDQQRWGRFPGVVAPSNLRPLRNRRMIFADPAVRLADRALRHHDAACLRLAPGQTGNVTPVSSSETVHRRRWMAVSWDCPLDSASFG
jgi:DNA-directed RNA polymerase specialized sigma24 family protein